MTPGAYDVYQANLASSGKLALRAKGRLAEGTADAVFEACVLLHEAARLQRLATQALPTCPAVSRLAAAVEECWYLVEGRDPPRAAEAWGQVLRDRQGVDEPTADAMLSRLAPRFEKSRREFLKTVGAAPTLMTITDARSLAAAPNVRSKARKELRAVLARFPGTPYFWWVEYRLAEQEGDKTAAWGALTRARQLDPNNQSYEASSLLLAAWALPRRAAEQHLARVRGSFDRAGAEVCLMHALAVLELAGGSKGGERAKRWEEARDAANSGLTQARTEELRRDLKAVQLLVGELLAGRVPTMEILYLAGLGEVASMAAPSASVVEVLTTTVRRAA
jgi:hypothetical protein